MAEGCAGSVELDEFRAPERAEVLGGGAADDDVVEERNAQDAAGGDEFARDGEVGRGDPFSSICSKALSTAGTLEIVSGLLGIALSIYVTYAFGGMSINGGTAISFTANLSFILIAVFLKMLAGISEFGRR